MHNFKPINGLDSAIEVHLCNTAISIRFGNFQLSSLRIVIAIDQTLSAHDMS